MLGKKHYLQQIFPTTQSILDLKSKQFSWCKYILQLVHLGSKSENLWSTLKLLNRLQVTNNTQSKNFPGPNNFCSCSMVWDPVDYIWNLFKPFRSKTTFLDYYGLHLHVETPATLLYNKVKWLGSMITDTSFPSTSGLVSKAVRTTVDQQC